MVELRIFWPTSPYLERRSSWNCLRNWAMLAGPVSIGRRLFVIGIVDWLGSSDIVILKICE